MNKKVLEENIYNLLEKLIENSGFYLVDVVYGTEGKNKVIRIVVDKTDGGVSIEDCTNISYLVGPVLEAEGISDMINGSYNLEISSPGMFRKLKSEKDYKRALGKRVKIKLKERIEKKSVIIGVLENYEREIFNIDEDKHTYRIEKNKIKSINLEPELDF